nr:hypothetical protein [Marinitoga lauensis]
MSILTKIFDKNKRILNRYKKIVEKINALEEKFEKLNDEQLKSKTDEFKKRLKDGETLDDILIEAFAVVRETAKRVLKMRHFDVQLMVVWHYMKEILLR